MRMDCRVTPLPCCSPPSRRRAAYEPALRGDVTTFDKLVGLKRAADVPYALLFGSHERALYRANRKNQLILNVMRAGPL